jgi:predicted AAA+ superfamily ATPase
MPMTLSELHSKDIDFKRCDALHKLKSRFSIQDFSKSMPSGGLPVPAFIRDPKQRDTFFQSWIETTIYRDAARAYGKNYDPEFAMQVILDFAKLHRAGILPTTSHTKYTARKIQRYLLAFQDVFLINKIPCHSSGIGKDAYLFSDSGIAAHLMGDSLSEGASLSLARISILNEILCLHRYQGKIFLPTYYKSHKGEPVDLVWNNLPIKISPTHNVSGWETRALEGALKTLKATRAIIAAPTDQMHLDKKINILPWTFWC